MKILVNNEIDKNILNKSKNKAKIKILQKWLVTLEKYYKMW